MFELGLEKRKHCKHWIEVLGESEEKGGEWAQNQYAEYLPYLVYAASNRKAIEVTKKSDVMTPSVWRAVSPS